MMLGNALFNSTEFQTYNTTREAGQQEKKT